MRKYRIKFPDGYSDYALEIESKGCVELDIEIYKKLYTFNFYNIDRLNQTVNDDLNSSQFFFYENLVVLESITIENIEKFIQNIVDTPYLNQFNLKRNKY